jgi:trigger factor
MPAQAIEEIKSTMTVTQEPAADSATTLERSLKITIPAEPIKTEVALWLKKKAPSAKIQGFRPGKVPANILEKQFGPQAHEEVVRNLVSETLYHALEKEKLVPAGYPEVELLSAEPGAALEYRAKFEVYPDIKLAALDGVTIEKRVATVTDADLDRVIDDLRKQHLQWKTVERAGKKGDRLTLDFAGTIDGEPLAGGTATDFPLVLGEANMIPGFEDGLMGMSAGEERILKLQFPEEYHAKEIAGKPVEFKINAHTVDESELPACDDQFAALMGVQEGGVERLRKEIRRTMENELEGRLETELKQHVLDKLIERNPIDVPKALVEHEAQGMQEDFFKRLGTSGKNQIKRGDVSHFFIDQAKRRVTMSLLLADLLEEQRKNLDPKRVEERIQRIANAYDNAEEVIKLHYGDKKRLADVEALVVEEQVVAKLLEPVTIVEKQATYYDVVKPEKA